MPSASLPSLPGELFGDILSLLDFYNIFTLYSTGDFRVCALITEKSSLRQLTMFWAPPLLHVPRLLSRMRHLEALELSYDYFRNNLSVDISALPTTLRRLKICAGHGRMELTHFLDMRKLRYIDVSAFPPHLEQLSAPNTRFTVESIQQLPSTLNKLELDTLPYEAVHYLPRRLESLTAGLSGTDTGVDPQFPPSLKHFTLTGFAAMSLLKWLPHAQLEMLQVNAVRPLGEPILQDEDVEVRWSAQKQLTSLTQRWEPSCPRLIHLLPPSLNTLTLKAPATVPPFDVVDLVSKLPRDLTSLSVPLPSKGAPDWLEWARQLPRALTSLRHPNTTIPWTPELLALAPPNLREIVTDRLPEVASHLPPSLTALSVDQLGPTSLLPPQPLPLALVHVRAGVWTSDVDPTFLLDCLALRPPPHLTYLSFEISEEQQLRQVTALTTLVTLEVLSSGQRMPLHVDFSALSRLQALKLPLVEPTFAENPFPLSLAEVKMDALLIDVSEVAKIMAPLSNLRRANFSQLKGTFCDSDAAVLPRSLLSLELNGVASYTASTKLSKDGIKSLPPLLCYMVLPSGLQETLADLQRYLPFLTYSASLINVYVKRG